MRRSFETRQLVCWYLRRPWNMLGDMHEVSELLGWDWQPAGIEAEIFVKERYSSPFVLSSFPLYSMPVFDEHNLRESAAFQRNWIEVVYYADARLMCKDLVRYFAWSSIINYLVLVGSSRRSAVGKRCSLNAKTSKTWCPQGPTSETIMGSMMY